MYQQEATARRARAPSAAPAYDAPRAAVDATERDLARLATASHDLRDPLQAIASYVDLLADGFCGPVTSEQRSYLTRVRGYVLHLAAVVDSILVLARAEHRGLAPELSDVAVAELLTDVHTLVEPFAAARGVSVAVDCERAPVAVRGERTALLRVLANLAANAVKFTPRGGRVCLSALGDSDAVELRVADTGPGIPCAQLETIFEPFVQAHATDEVDRRGAGLGLAIARDLTRLMGGELFVRSAVGVGSLFAARFPTTPVPRSGRSEIPRCGDAAAAWIAQIRPAKEAP
jgi:signal transduction histidine kinase